MAQDKKTTKTNKKSPVTPKEDPKKAPVKKDEPKKEGKKETEKSTPPRSSKLKHQFTPFLLFAIAILISVCIVGAKAFSADMGIAGNFISSGFCGLFGLSAFLIPVIFVYLGATWGKSIDEGRVAPKVIFSILSMMFVSVLVHVICNFSAAPSFELSYLWEIGESLGGGGILGGLLSDLLVTLFKQWGTIIITLSCLAISLMFLFNITPKTVWTYVRYKKKLRAERKLELMAAREAAKEEEERQKKIAAEKERIIAISKAAEEELEVEEEEAPEEESGNEKKTVLRIKKREKIEEKIEETVETVETVEEAPEVKEIKEEKTNEKPPVILPSEPDDDDGVRLGEIFDNEENTGRDKDGIIAIDLSNHSIEKDDPSEKTPAEAPEKKPKLESAKPAEKKDDDVVLNMKDNAETLSELEGLRGDEKEVEVQVERIYAYPPISLLRADNNPKNTDDSEETKEKALILRETLKSFNIGIKDEILCSRGPTITRYELRPEVGVRVRSIANLVDDISLSLASSGVRIEAPIPNKPYVGIEVPNRNRLTVFLRSLIEDEKFANDPSKLISCLGSDVGGNPVFFDISKMPHLLIAGATGMGKSVCINSIIISILYKATPDEVKLILIDPKQVEFTIYQDCPHLYAPIVTDPKKAAGALASAVAEMDRRFELMKDVGVREVNSYNAITANDPDREYLPKMVIIIDELADLMMTAPGEVESSICRLAQKARAAGIHIIIGTQRPSVDVITGLIKANVPSRIACTVASQVDSRTIIDIAGAEKLIGRGDMLFAPVGISKPMRVQGCFVSDSEVEAVVEFIKANNSKAEYNKNFISIMESEAAKCGQSGKKGGGGSSDGGDGGDGGESDPKFREAVKLAIDAGKISTSLMQRMLGVGYGRAAKIIDKMEDLGYVSAPDGNKPRRVLITMQEYMEKVINDDIEEGGSSDEDFDE